MILIDTSVWVDYLRRPELKLAGLLEQDSVATHTLIIEELACGHLANRDEIIGILERLPRNSQATHPEIMDFIVRHSLYDSGLDIVDIHLLASALLAGTPIWTRDKILSYAAKRLDVLAPHT